MSDQIKDAGYDEQFEKEAILNAVEEAIKNSVSEDMDPKRVIERAGMITAFFGMSRTSAVGALVYGALYARIVGVDVAKQHELLTVIDDVLNKSPFTAVAQEKYAAANKAYHEQKALNEFSDLEGQQVLPNSGKVH